MVCDKNELFMKSPTVVKSYYFAIERFNENGVSEVTEPFLVE